MSTVKTVAITNGKSKPAKGFWTTETPMPVANAITTKAAKPAKTQAAPKAEAAPRTETCLCGCGAMPTGKKARFLPGHDGRLKGRLLAAAKAGDAAAVARMTELGWAKFLPTA